MTEPKTRNRDYIYIPEPPRTFPLCPHCGTTSEGAPILNFRWKTTRVGKNIFREVPNIEVQCPSCGQRYWVVGPPMIYREEE